MHKNFAKITTVLTFSVALAMPALSADKDKSLYERLGGKKSITAVKRPPTRNA